MAVDPLRTRVPENQEQPIALMYGFLYVTDAEEGLIVVGDPDLKAKRPGVLTLLDGDPTNNFLKRATTFNPGGALSGAATYHHRRELRLHPHAARPRRGRYLESASAENDLDKSTSWNPPGSQSSSAMPS